MTDTSTLTPTPGAACACVRIEPAPGRKPFVQSLLESAARDAARAAEILAEIAQASGDMHLVPDRQARRAFHADASDDVSKAAAHLLAARKSACGARFFFDASAQDRIPPAAYHWPDHPCLELARALLPAGTGDEIEEAAALISLKVGSWR